MEFPKVHDEGKELISKNYKQYQETFMLEKKKIERSLIKIRLPFT